MATIDFLKALGWQGGTIHQGLTETRRLRGIENQLIEVLLNRVDDGYSTICRCCGCRECSDHCISRSLTEEGRDKLRVLRMKSGDL